MKMSLYLRLLATSCVIWAAATISGCGGPSQQQSPQKAIDYYASGKLLMSQEQYDEALAELAKSIQSDPNLSVAHSAMGDIYLKKENLELAKRSYEKAAKANPYAFKPLYNLGVVYQRLAEAEQALTKVQDILAQAIRAYLRALTIKGNDYDANLNLGVCYFQLGKLDLAEQYCKAAMEVDPKNPAAYNNLGVICDSQDRLYDAVRYYKESLELNVNQPRILLNLGQTYIKQGRMAHALHAFEIASEQMPDDCAPWEQMGACHYSLNELEKALAAYTKATELNHRSASAHRGLGVVYMSLYVRDSTKTDLRDKAIDAWNLSLEQAPNQPDLRKLIEKYQPKRTEPPKL